MCLILAVLNRDENRGYFSLAVLNLDDNSGSYSPLRAVGTRGNVPRVRG